MGEDDYSWLMDGGLDGSGGGLDQTLLPLMPTPDDGSLYNPMTPFDPTDPSYGSGTINWDGSSVPQLNTGGGSSSNPLASIMHSLGLRDMGNGGLGQLLMAALGIGGGLFNRTQTQHATDQTVGALRDANNQITGILGGNSAAFQPYADLGSYAAHGLQSLPLTPIAGNFNSLGTGRGIKLGALSGH